MGAVSLGCFGGRCASGTGSEDTPEVYSNRKVGLIYSILHRGYCTYRDLDKNLAGDAPSVGNDVAGTDQNEALGPAASISNCSFTPSFISVIVRTRFCPKNLEGEFPQGQVGDLNGGCRIACRIEQCKTCDGRVPARTGWRL